MTVAGGLFLRPLVEYAPGLAQRALQRFGCHRPDARVDAGRVLDVGGDLLRVFDEAAAVPDLGPRFRQDRHHVHPSLARQVNDEMTAAPLAAQARSRAAVVAVGVGSELRSVQAWY